MGRPSALGRISNKGFDKLRGRGLLTFRFYQHPRDLGHIFEDREGLSTRWLKPWDLEGRISNKKKRRVQQRNFVYQRVGRASVPHRTPQNFIGGLPTRLTKMPNGPERKLNILICDESHDRGALASDHGRRARFNRHGRSPVFNDQLPFGHTIPPTAPPKCSAIAAQVVHAVFIPVYPQRL